MNVYGELTRAQIHLSGSDLSPAALGLIYFDTSALVAKVYNGSAWKILVDTTTSQVLTNKDYDGGTASNTSRITLPKASSATLSGLTRKAGTMVFDTSVNKAFIDDGTNLNAFGSGSGEINLVDNGSDSNSWAVSGGGIAVATSTTSSDLPLSGIFDTCLKITPASGTDYAYYRFTMPEALKGRKLKITWHQRPLSGYASGDIKIEMYKNAASNYSGAYTEFALSTDSSGTSSVPNLTGQFTTYFDADSGDYYEIRFVRTAGTTALNVAGLIVGPGIQPQGAVVGDVISGVYDLSWSAGFGSTSDRSLTVTRVGTRAIFRGSVTAGTVAGSTASATLPTGFTIDSTKFSAVSNVQGIGTLRRLNNTSTVFGSNVPLTIFYDGSTTNTIYFCNTMTTNAYQKENGTTILTSNQIMDFEFTIPVAEWANSGTVNLAQNDVEYVSNSETSANTTNTTSFQYGPNGAAVLSQTSTTNLRVRLTRPITQYTRLDLEFRDALTGHWYPINGHRDNGYSALVNSGNSYGVYIHPVSSSETDIDVTFYPYSRTASGGTFGSAGVAWSTSKTFMDRWRLKRTEGGVAAGFGTVSENSSGLMPANHANLDNATATRLGLKTYAHGTTYNGGNAPTVSGTGTTVVAASFVPYQMQSGSWRMKFNISTTQTGTTSKTLAVNGVVFKNVSNHRQAVIVHGNGSGYDKGTVEENAGNILTVSGASNTDLRVSGDVELESKPTWAY